MGMRVAITVLAAIACIAAGGAHAQAASTVIYRCTDATGALTVQNGTPCPKGSKQDKRTIAAPVVMPAYVAPLPPPVAPVAAPAPDAVPAAPVVEPRPDVPVPATIAAADRLPPPPIYQCSTYENTTYLSEDFEPKPRCVRVAVTGVNGDPNAGAGEACEMKYDLCARVPDAGACDGWKQRQREVESTWRYAPGGGKRPLQDEFARISRILSDTTCGL